MSQIPRQNDQEPDPLGQGGVNGARRVWQTAVRLQRMVSDVAADEFYAYDARYNEDSGLGRELLFLIANHEWVRATSEIINIARSDVIGTTLKIDIDLRQITHEAFRGRTGRIWLPIAVLPPQPGQRDLELDLFASVTDASGNLLPLLPADELRRQIASALAEIVVNMAAAHMRGSESSRDERVLLSAAIYRLLHDPSRCDDDSVSPDGTATAGGPPQPQGGPSQLQTPRIRAARDALLRLINPYIDLLHQRALSRTPREQFVPELAHRAILVLQALADSVVIVVPADYSIPPTVLTVRVPDRPLMPASAPVARRKPSTWLVGFSGHLAVDLLLPTADADRQIQVELPDGLSFGQSVSTAESGSPLPRLDVAVKWPPAVEEFLASLDHVAGPGQASDATILGALADFARAKGALAMQSLRYYERVSAEPAQAGAAGSSATASSAPASLAAIVQAVDSVEMADQSTLASLRRQLDDARQSPPGLLRRVSLRRTGPRTILARSAMIPEVGQRATPERATAHLDVRLDVRDYLSVATRSAAMSLMLMAGVLLFLLGYAAAGSTASPAAEVLAIVLTLFATIQASRISGPDQSTLRGRLSVIADWLIAGSMLPPVILAVALAFQPHGWTAVIWATVFTAVQGLALVVMLYGPLSPGASRRRSLYDRLRIGRPQNFRTAPLDYSRLEPLRSDYWRNTTADALMIGRLAHGYVVWQDASSAGSRPLLAPLLRPHRAVRAPDERSSVLALLHSSTQRQAMTFVVFRGQPDSDWPTGVSGQVRELELDPDRLAPMDNISDTVDVFIGVYASEMPVLARHPLLAVIEAARNKLILLEVELPVPPPDSRYRDRQWARVRVAVRDAGDLGRLPGFLEAIRTQISESGQDGLAVAVQTVPTAPPRIIAETARPRYAGVGEPVLTGDLDVSNVRALAGEPPDAMTWRMVVMCAEARSNIESDLIGHLIRQLQALPHSIFRFQLAHLNYARLHGTAVVIVLLHDLGEEHGAAESAAGGWLAVGDSSSRSQSDGPEWGRPQIVVDESVSPGRLGPLVQYPLLRVRYRWQDRPGALANVIRSINNALGKEDPPISPANWSVSYARAHVASGHTALGYLTIRIHDPVHAGQDWTTTKIERVARRVGSALAGLGAVAAEGDVVLASDRRELEGPVIRLDMISRSVPPASPPAC